MHTRMHTHSQFLVDLPSYTGLLKLRTFPKSKRLEFIMAALRSRCGHYIFALWFLSSIFFCFSLPNVSRHRSDVYHTCTHGVALVRI